MKLWKGGSEVASSDRKNFVRKPWGERVDFHVETIQTLKDSHWKKIDTAAMPYVKAAQASGAALGDGDEEDDDTGRKVVIKVSSDEDSE